MELLPIRLTPGQDLRLALEALGRTPAAPSGFVLAGIGSLSVAHLRFAAAQDASEVSGPLEILTLSGSLSPAGAHLHISVADASGAVLGGHLCRGSLVRTTAEIVLVTLAGWSLTRAYDPDSGFEELQVRRNQAST